MAYVKAQTRTHATSRTRRSSGFTVVEVLISAAILMLLLGGTSGLLVTSLRAYRTNVTVTERTQDVEAAVRVITYDLQLAGLRGIDPADVDDDTRDFDGNPTIEVVKGADATSPDQLTIRYYESADRRYGADDECGAYCEVTFQLGQDDDGTSVLLRIQGDGATAEQQGIIRDMNNIKVLGFLTRSGVSVAATDGATVPVGNLSALNLELTLSNGGVWRFPVAIPNRQTVTITSGS